MTCTTVLPPTTHSFTKLPLPHPQRTRNAPSTHETHPQRTQRTPQRSIKTHGKKATQIQRTMSKNDMYTSNYPMFRQFELRCILLGKEPRLTTLTGGNYETQDFSLYDVAVQKEMQELRKLSSIIRDPWFESFKEWVRYESNLKLLLYGRSHAFTNYKVLDGYDCSGWFITLRDVPYDCMVIPTMEELLSSASLFNDDNQRVDVRTMVLVIKFFDSLRQTTALQQKLAKETITVDMGECRVEASVHYMEEALLGDQDDFCFASRRRSPKEVEDFLRRSNYDVNKINTKRHELCKEFCGDIVIYKEWSIEIRADSADYETSLYFFQQCTEKDVAVISQRLKN